MKHLFTTLLLLFAFTLHAQNQPTQVLCGNTWFELLVHHQYPELETAFRHTFDQAKAAANPVAERTPFTVQVVVHVVWKNPEENLADSVILDQLAVLNEDYNRLNADAGNLRPVFQPFAGTTDIHFNLAAIERVLAAGEVRTPDLGGRHTTTEMAEATSLRSVRTRVPASVLLAE